jgi:nucleoid DNA-binding protein
MAKKTAKKKSTKYNFIAELHENLVNAMEVTRNGAVKIKRSDMKNLIETAFTTAAKHAAQGERVRFPVIGALVRKEVMAKKGGVKTTNPFTGEPMVTKARPATKKPRWSFPKGLKETFANKKNW